MSDRNSFRLQIQQVEQACLFDLSWGKGQHLSAQVAYPHALEAAYQTWLRCYLGFYKTLDSDAEGSSATFRGELKAQGRLTPMGVDWHTELVQAEARLLHQLHHWLRNSALFDIRAAITEPADLLLVCSPLSLARLPWETWPLGNVRIARCPAQVKAASCKPQQRHRVRVLAILGDETGLNLTADREAVQALATKAEVQFVGGQPGLSVTKLKRQICDEIAHPQGWDILFFAGHSDETDLTGGKVAIAPNTTLTIQELAPHLKQLQEKGLQLAIFNSCSGLSIATALIDMGLSQVVVMREPIHNHLAQSFLGRFLGHLSLYKSTHEALEAAVTELRSDALHYPSAHLVPSLFRHPDAPLFQLQPAGLRHHLRRWRLSRREAVALAVLTTLSLWPSVQHTLLDQRVGIQAIYRMLTNQIPPPTTPPVALIHIDEVSLQKAQIQDPNPMDRAYLAQLVTRLAAKKSQIIGFDYLFDRPQPDNDLRLAAAVRSAVAEHQTWFVFGAIANADGSEQGVDPSTHIASPAWSLQAHINGVPTHVTLPSFDCRQSCPFAYLLSLLVPHQQQELGQIRPNLEAQGNLKTRLLNESTFATPRHPHWIATLSAYAGQQWLQPILDFSIPPEQVYQRVPAWQLLAEDVNLSSPIVLIASGGYEDAGITPQSDNFPIPAALEFWQLSLLDHDERPSASVFTGGEAHAYMVHHLLEQRLVIPIPDVWMVLLASLLGKAIVLKWGYSLTQRQRLGVGIGGTSLYGLVSLQGYLSAAVLLPWLLPSITIWFYILPFARMRNDG